MGVPLPAFRRASFYLALLRVGFDRRRVTTVGRALLPPDFTLTCATDAEASGPSAVCFCATFHRTVLSSDAPGRYPAPCPWSPDFPPRLQKAACAAIRPPALLTVGNYKDARR